MKKLWVAIIFVVALAFIPSLALANSADFDGGVAIGSDYVGIPAPPEGAIVHGYVGYAGPGW